MATAKTPKAPATPAETLKNAVADLAIAAADYAASEEGRTLHSFDADGFRVLLMGEQLSSVVAK